MRTHGGRVALSIMVLLSLAGFGSAAATDEGHDEAQGADGVQVPYIDLYCGLWSVFAAGQILDRPVPFLDLLDGGWVDGRGSTSEQIREAAAWSGLESDEVRLWTTLDLRLSPHPVVLHTRSDPGADEYNHWVLYVGERDGRAVLVDGPREPVEMSFATLSSQWDGIGIVLHQGASAATLASGRWLLIVTLVLVAILALMAIRGLSREGRRSGPERFGASFFVRPLARKSLAFAGIPIAALGLALGQHWGLGSGMLRHGEVVAAIQRKHVTAFLPELSLIDIEKIVDDGLTDGRVVLIDARPAVQFERGHIPGAILLPATGFSDTQIEKLPDRHVPIVVYCSAPACGYDDEVAAFLVERGYQNVSLFPDGMKAWFDASLPIQTGGGYE